MTAPRLTREEVEQALADACRGGPDRLSLAHDWLLLHDRLREAERARDAYRSALGRSSLGDLERGLVDLDLKDSTP